MDIESTGEYLRNACAILLFEEVEVSGTHYTVEMPET